MIRLCHGCDLEATEIEATEIEATEIEEIEAREITDLETEERSHRSQRIRSLSDSPIRRGRALRARVEF